MNAHLFKLQTKIFWHELKCFNQNIETSTRIKYWTYFLYLIKRLLFFEISKKRVQTYPKLIISIKEQNEIMHIQIFRGKSNCLRSKINSSFWIYLYQLLFYFSPLNFWILLHLGNGAIRVSHQIRILNSGHVLHSWNHALSRNASFFSPNRSKLWGRITHQTQYTT